MLRVQFFSWDTGSQLGEVIPHSKKNITCDFKPSRPFKVRERVRCCAQSCQQSACPVSLDSAVC
jgi:hypothetical protein